MDSRMTSSLSQPFFLITVSSQVVAWSLTFIAQCLAEAKHHASRGSDGSKLTGTPIGIGWFAIFYQLFIFYRVVSTVMLECEYQVRDQLATLVALNVVLGVLCSNSAIYAQHEIALTLYGYGWMVLATLNLTWLIYFTSSDRSRLISLLNPSFQRKQLIRTSINLRRSASYSNNLPNIANDYDGAHEITLGAGRVVDANSNPDNEKLLNEITSALLPSDYPHMSEGYNDHDPARISLSHQPGNHMTSSALQNQALLRNNAIGIKFQQDQQSFQQDQQSKPLNHQYDPIHLNSSSQLHQENHSQPWQRQYTNHHLNRVEPPSNTYQQTLPPQHPDPFESSGSATSASSVAGANLQPYTMPLIDRTLLNQAYRQEELRSVTNSEIPNSIPGAKTEEPPIVRAKALYAYKASITDPNEMSFEKSETLEILNHSGKWWQAKRATGESGIVPSNYLKILSEQ